MTFVYPSNRAILETLAYRSEQQVGVPSVQTRTTSMVLPSSSRLATGFPATPTPASLPGLTAATSNLPLTVGTLRRWYLAMNAFASLMWIGTACTLPLIL